MGLFRDIQYILLSLLGYCGAVNASENLLVKHVPQSPFHAGWKMVVYDGTQSVGEARCTVITTQPSCEFWLDISEAKPDVVTALINASRDAIENFVAHIYCTCGDQHEKRAWCIQCSNKRIKSILAREGFVTSSVDSAIMEFSSVS